MTLQKTLIVFAAGMVLLGCEDPKESEAEAEARHERNRLKAAYEVKSTLHACAIRQFEMDFEAFKMDVTEDGMRQLEARIKILKQESEEVNQAYDRAIRAGVVFSKK